MSHPRPPAVREPIGGCLTMIILATGAALLALAIWWVHTYAFPASGDPTWRPTLDPAPSASAVPLAPIAPAGAAVLALMTYVRTAAARTARGLAALAALRRRYRRGAHRAVSPRKRGMHSVAVRGAFARLQTLALVERLALANARIIGQHVVTS